MKIRFLLLGTSLSLIPQTINAQCVATQDCATLGYTETSCSGGSGVKCPFGNWWACLKSDSEIKDQLCTELGFTLTCTDTYQTGGGSKDCNGKYNYCSCADGYLWKDGTCKSSEPDYSACTIGALFYSDNTCSDKLESSKTLLGVVIYEKSGSQMGWIMTVKPIQTAIAWGDIKDIPEITNCTSISCLTDIQSSCINTDAITAYGNSSTYPAAWTAKSYKPTGTPNGKNWCLPSGGLLNNITNSANLTKINTGISIAGGTKLGDANSNEYISIEWIWSSSDYDSHDAWHLEVSTPSYSSISSSMKTYNKGSTLYSFSVRPVLAF